MLSEERVKLMTRMAMCEEKEGRKIQPAKKYRKRDYVSLCTIGGFFLGTICYGVVYLGILAVLFSTVLINLHLLTFLICVIAGILLYILYMYLYLQSVRKRARHRYDEGMELIKKLRQDYLRLEEIYAKEEAMKSPEGWN
jgi:Flp pilus assembly protein TadB